VLKFTPDDENIYETKLLIDGLTKKSEAYLYRNGVALNDGLKGSYDREIVKLFGTPKLFFNSVFAAQKTKGIFALKEGERRELFYEILDIDEYTVREENAKKYLQKEQNRLNVLESEIKIFTGEITVCNITKEDIEKKIYEREELSSAKTMGEVKLKETRKGIDDLNIVVAGLGVKIEQQQEITNRISELTEEIEFQDEKKQLELTEIEGEKEAALNTFTSSNEFDKHIKELETKKNFLNEEFEKENEEISGSIATMNDEINANDLKKVQIEAKISRSKTILENKGTIDVNLDEKRKCTDEAAKILALEKEHLLEIGKLQEGKEGEEKLLQVLRESYANTDKVKSQKDHQLTTVNELIASLEELKKTGLDRLKEEISTIDKVPCSEVVGRGCMFLTRAMESKDTLKDVENDYDAKIVGKEEARDAIFGEIENTEKFLDEANEEIKAKEKEIKDSFTDQIALINEKVDALRVKIKEVAGKLAELAKTNWEALDKELAEAERNAELWQNEIEGLDKACDDKRKQIKDLQERLVNIQERLTNNIKDVEKQIVTHNDLLEKEKKTIISFYAEKKKTTSARYEAQSESLNKELTANKEKIDETLQRQKTEKEIMLRNSRVEIEEEETWLKGTEKELTDLQVEIAELNEKLIKKQSLVDRIAVKNAERLFVEEEIRQWSVVREAMSKTGIPVLKLEVSGTGISKLTNNFLSNYENKFRVVFETTSFTKKDKKQIEVFDIKVLDEDGICNIDYKSGGQKTEIETALQLAIAHFKREQGKVKAKTGYLDEGDGALDLKSANRYFKVIEEAHRLSGVFNTIVITHRPELIERISQRIELSDGYFEIIRN
jgi:DNA repair exonuclease SbcCD ATPase subunit